MTFATAEFLTLAPSSDRIPVELFQILKDDAVESAALNMQYAGSRQGTQQMSVERRKGEREVKREGGRERGRKEKRAIFQVF